MTLLAQLPYLQPGECALLFDGECNLCHGLVRYLIRADRQRRVLLATVQSVEGRGDPAGVWVADRPFRFRGLC